MLKPSLGFRLANHYFKIRGYRYNLSFFKPRLATKGKTWNWFTCQYGTAITGLFFHLLITKDSTNA